MSQFGTQEHYEEYVRNCRNAGIIPEAWEEFQLQCSREYPTDYNPDAIIVQLEADNAALKAKVARLEAALAPFAKLSGFRGWDTSAQHVDSIVFQADDYVLTRGDFESAKEALGKGNERN